MVEITEEEAYHWNSRTECSDSQTTDQTTNGQLLPSAECDHLDENTDAENTALDDHGIPTSEEVSRSVERLADLLRQKGLLCLRCTDERSEKSADGEKTDDEAGADVAELACRHIPRSLALGKAQEEVVHEQHIRNLTSVVAENEASHTGYDSQHDGYAANGHTLTAETLGKRRGKSRSTYT